MELTLYFLNFVFYMSLLFTAISISIDYAVNKEQTLSQFLGKFCIEYKKEYGTEVSLISKIIFVSLLIFAEFFMNFITTLIIFSIIITGASLWNIIT